MSQPVGQVVQLAGAAGTLAMMKLPELKTPLGRAVAPVAAGLAFFAVLGLVLWGVASYQSANSDEVSTQFAPKLVDLGSTRTFSAMIADDGPLLFQDLLGTTARRSIVLDHTGDDPNNNWAIYMAYPADRTVDCKVEQVEGTRRFIDCEQRELQVEQLAAPEAGVAPLISQDGKLSLDLRPGDDS